MWGRDVYRPVGVKPGHCGEWSQFIEIGERGTAVRAQLVADPIEHQHFAV